MAENPFRPRFTVSEEAPFDLQVQSTVEMSVIVSDFLGRYYASQHGGLAGSESVIVSKMIPVPVAVKELQDYLDACLFHPPTTPQNYHNFDIIKDLIPHFRAAVQFKRVSYLFLLILFPGR